MARITYGDEGDNVTVYEEEDGCGGCRVPIGLPQCQNCWDLETGKHRNFESAIDYWKRVQ